MNIATKGEAVGGDIGRGLDIAVRRPSTRDVSGLASLFSEMQRHYGRPVSDALAMDAAALACRPIVSTFDPRVLLALADGSIVGSAVLNVTFPAFELTRALYVRDLYVAQAQRRRGVGQALVRAAAHLTVVDGYSALDWTTDAENAVARSMYEGCGARRLNRTYYRLSEDSLDRYRTAEVEITSFIDET